MNKIDKLKKELNEITKKKQNRISSIESIMRDFEEIDKQVQKERSQNQKSLIIQAKGNNIDLLKSTDWVVFTDQEENVYKETLQDCVKRLIYLGCETPDFEIINQCLRYGYYDFLKTIYDEDTRKKEPYRLAEIEYKPNHDYPLR